MIPISRAVAALALVFAIAAAAAHGAGLGSRVFVVERASGRLAVYELDQRALLPGRIEGPGDLSHAEGGRGKVSVALDGG